MVPASFSAGQEPAGNPNPSDHPNVQHPFIVSKAPSFFILGILIGVLAAGGWFAWLGGSDTEDAAGARVLKIAHSLPNSHPVHLGLVELKNRAEELSGGKMKINIFPSEQLGTEVQCLEKVQAGTLDITKVSAAPIGNFVPAYSVFSLPYLFRDEDHFWKVLEGPVGDEMLEVLATRGDGSPSGLHGLGYFDSGSRSFYTVNPVTSPADLEGKKIRVMNDPVAMDMVQAMGGSPTPIAFGELYTALKQGTVDGAENNPPSFVTSRHYEICKNYTLDHHSRVPDVIVVSSKVWETLSSEEREWLTQAMEHATAFQRDLWKVETEKSLKMLRDEGVKIIEPDIEAFRASSAGIIKKYSDKVIGPLVEKIQAVN
jgi:tripartite ATP-independent transporter DctP family solute receptor